MSNLIGGESRRVARIVLLAGTAMLAMPAMAQETAQSVTPGDFAPVLEAHSGATTRPATFITEAVSPEPQIVISNPGTSTTARDTGVTGVGQMVVDQQNGFIGLCTGSLINPRTVIFAAHCVNSRPATAYGAGGTPISFGFSADNLPAVQRWFSATIGGQPNAQRYQSNPGLFLFNVNQVRYNPFSLEPDAASFLYGDVATATLDTPAANVPTWAMLFSPLPATPGGPGGTGYNVQIAGYGSHGNATTGSASGSDFRRRTAENVIGALTDLSTFESFLFGEPPSTLTQNLYFIDFDDPRRGLTGASPFDFNAFRDNARVSGTTPTEGTTASGDSGGPLILQRARFGRDLITGVLSGGYTRFFNGQPANGYGTVSFYQPLFLYWDWIAANNPYRYVTNLDGDRNWTNAANWTTINDPNYFVIGANGQLVNGTPTTLGQQKNGTGNGFGEICFESGGNSECLNVATGTLTTARRPIGTGGDDVALDAPAGAVNNAATMAFDGDGFVAASRPEAFAVSTAATVPVPAPTIANGLAGARDFVPNNIDPVRTTGAIGRYFDVTLTGNGTTTLDTSVTIDRFTIGGAGSRLAITSTGALSSLIDVRQFAGIMTVNGSLTSRGDFLLAGGALMGTGRINAPFTTNILGTISPGTETTIGNLTFAGNLVLSSGSNLFINLGGNGASDLVSVVAAGTSTGTATLGGRVVFAPTAGSMVRFNDQYTILTAAGGVTGTFAGATELSAILRPQFTYNANSVGVRIIAGTYASVVANTPVQRAYAQLLDQNRSNYAALADVYGPLDLGSSLFIRDTLEFLAPRTEQLVRSLGTVTTDNLARFYRERLSTIEPGASRGGTLTMTGRPLQLASLAVDPAGAAMGGVQVMSDAGDTVMAQGQLPDNMAAYFVGGYLDGSSRTMATAIPGGRDQFDGYYVIGGIEADVGSDSVVGLGLSYTRADGRTVGGLGTARTTLWSGTLYAKQVSEGGLAIDAQVSAGALQANTRRNAVIGNQVFDLRSRDGTLALSTEVGVGYQLGSDAFSITPRVAMRAAQIGFTPTAETGEGPALNFTRNKLSSAQARAGVAVKANGGFRPFASAYYVHDFRDSPAVFGANFVGGIGGNATFALGSNDQDWYEVGGGIAFDDGNVSVALSGDTTLARKDVKNSSVRGSVTIRF